MAAAPDSKKNRQPPVESGLARVRRMAEQGDHAGAFALLTELEREYPRSGLLWQQRAAHHRARGDTAAAIAAYRRAVELNHTLAPSWQALGELYRAVGRRADADYAAACLAWIKGLPAQLTEGSNLLNEGETEAA